MPLNIITESLMKLLKATFIKFDKGRIAKCTKIRSWKWLHCGKAEFYINIASIDHFRMFIVAPCISYSHSISTTTGAHT